MNLRAPTPTHRLPVQLILFLLVFLFVSLAVSAQDGSPSSPASYPFLLRLERTTASSDVCALLRPGGEFHLERSRGDETLVSEGQIPESELQQLKLALENDDLRRLPQQSIVAPMLYQIEDRLQINVFRTDHWQNLVFPDANSQGPYREILKPLVNWLSELHSHPHRELSEDEGKNNCLPPEKLRLKTRSDDASNVKQEHDSAPGSGAADTVQSESNPPNPFLMRYSSEHVSNGSLERTCVIVNSAGQFRMEKGNQPATFKMKMEVFGGFFSPIELEELDRLLNAPDLKTLRHQNHIPELTVRDAEVISLAIPRSKDIQELIFSSYVGVSSHAGTPSNATDDTTPIRPIQKWLGTSIASQKLVPLKSARPDNCAAAP